MTGPVRAWILILAVAGLAASVGSTYVHYQLVSDPGYTSFCDLNETVSCTTLYESRYGSVAGVPMALAGVLWFAVALLLVMADARGPAASRENIAAYFLVWSTVGLSVSMYMAFASFYVLRAFCLLCAVVYVAVIGIFLLTGSGTSTPLRRLPAAILGDLGRLVRRPVGLVVSAVVVGGVALAAAWFPVESRLAASPTSGTGDASRSSGPLSAEDQRSEFQRYWEDQARVEVEIETDAEVDDAAVVVYKFNDYQCPACAQTHLAYEPVFAKYDSLDPGSVALVLVDFPLDPSCNRESPNGPHDWACEAAVAARLAREVGEEEGRRMQRWLYMNQQTMTGEAIAEALAAVAGVDEGLLEARYDEVVEEVRADVAAGARLPVDATPTFVINGVLLKGGLSPEFFDQAIALELERARATTP